MKERKFSDLIKGVVLIIGSVVAISSCGWLGNAIEILQNIGK